MMIKKFSIALLAAFGVGGFTSCSDYLNTDKYFEDRVTIESVFADKERVEQWLAYAYSFLGGDNADVGTKDATRNSFTFDDCYYYGDRDINYDSKEGSQLSYEKFRLGEYDENSWNGAWDRCYKGIYQASVFIHNVDKNPEMTPEEKLDYKGQARFVRAYYYWLLLRRYGPIPLLPDEGVDYTQSYDDIATPRSTYEECAEFISNEMLQAAKEIQYLTRNGEENVARPTKGAALATRAYALIFAASPLANGNNDEFAQQMVDDQGRRLLSPEYDESKWARAAAACLDVMNLPGDNHGYRYEVYTVSANTADVGPQSRPTITPPYDPEFSDQDWPNGWRNIDPYKSYRDFFDGDASPVNNPELIWSRMANDGNGMIDLSVHQMPRTYGGWNTHGMTQKMVDAYYMADGSDCPGKDREIGRGDGSERLKGFTTLEDMKEGKYPELGAKYSEFDLSKPDKDQPGVGISLQYVNREPRFYASVGYNGSVWHYLNRTETADHNVKTWYYRGDGNGFMNNQFHLRTGIGVKKYVNPRDVNGNIVWRYEPAIRFGDILLLYAEALNELDGSYQIASWDGAETYTISRNIDDIKRGTHPIRIRAGLPDYAPQIYANKDELRKALKRERMIELFAEGKRYWDLRRWKDAPVEEALDIYGLNIYLNENQAEDFHTPIPVYDLRTTFAPKMYFWPITHNELKHNKRLTQAPGWTTYD